MKQYHLIHHYPVHSAFMRSEKPTFQGGDHSLVIAPHPNSWDLAKGMGLFVWGDYLLFKIRTWGRKKNGH